MFSEKNIYIQPADVKSILSQYGVEPTIRNFDLYKRAFIHSSCSLEMLKTCENKEEICVDSLHSKSNERLEFLGDGVLEFVTKFYLYQRFPKEQEGFMTDKKIAIVKNETIGKFAYEIGLHKWYIMSSDMEEKGLRSNIKKLGCLFEAFLGAIFLDFNGCTASVNVNDVPISMSLGFHMASLFLTNVLEHHVDWTHLINTYDNYKNILQELTQKEFGITPIYKDLKQQHTAEEEFHMGVYLCFQSLPHEISDETVWRPEVVSIQNIQEKIKSQPKTIVFLGSGMHWVKKKAEQLACKSILQQLA